MIFLISFIFLLDFKFIKALKRHMKEKIKKKFRKNLNINNPLNFLII